MKYPEDCNSPRRRTEFLYKAQEELRILHNVFSKWLHEGLTQKEYDLISREIKNKYPYISKLSNADFAKFKDEIFTPKSDRICQKICVQRALLKTSNWLVDIGDI